MHKNIIEIIIVIQIICCHNNIIIMQLYSSVPRTEKKREKENVESVEGRSNSEQRNQRITF